MTKKKVIDEIRDQGYSIIEGLLSEKECNYYRGLIEKTYEKYSPKYADHKNFKKFHGENVKLIYNLHNKHIDFLKLIDHPRITPIIRELLQMGSYQNSEPFILKLTTARSPFGKSKKQQLHIDSGVPGSSYPLVIQTIIAIDEFTKENGSTRVIPKSHKLKEFAKDGKTYPNEKNLNIPKGSIVIYDGGLWHGSGEKITEGDRWAIINTYARWIFRPSYDFNRNTPLGIYKKLTDFQKELLGFKFNPAVDEFTRLSRQSEDFEKPSNYKLPS